MLKLGTKDIKGLYLGDKKIEKAYIGDSLVFEAAKPSRLPAGYTEVEYINTVSAMKYLTGQIINTATDRFEFMFRPRAQSSYDGYLFGSEVTNSSDACVFVYIPKGTTGVRYALNRAGTLPKTYSFDSTTFTKQNHLVVCDFPSKTVDFDGVQQTTGAVSKNNTFNNFSIGYDTTTSARAMLGYIYYAKLYQSNVLIMDLVPCTDPDGAVGFYDIIGGKFIKNSNTGKPTAGPAV